MQSIAKNRGKDMHGNMRMGDCARYCHRDAIARRNLAALQQNYQSKSNVSHTSNILANCTENNWCGPLRSVQDVDVLGGRTSG